MSRETTTGKVVFMNFNENQIKAVSHKAGPAMILAGPGSGKTTIITHRIKKLIESGVSPEKILVVTFTKAAATHMQKKFFHIMQGENWVGKSYPVSFGTFHSVYFRILKLTKNYKGENILTENQKYQMLREIAIRKKIDVSSMNEFLQNLSSEISNIKGNMIDVNEYEPKSCSKEDFNCVLREYEKALEWERKIDFDDMLLKCYQIFTENPNILNQWQQIFEYILIDEFQDINYVQYEIIKMLALPENNLFIVGDDDQSIYGFRGACPELMFRFKDDFPQCSEILLNINYRSIENIVTISERLINNNSHRFIKNIQSHLGMGEEPDIKLFKTQFDELEYVEKKIKELNNKGIGNSEIAILIRNNNQIPVIQNFLLNRGIAINGGKNNIGLYESAVAKDILDYVKAALSYQNIEIQENQELIHILNKPARYISRKILSEEGMNLKKIKEIYRHNLEIKNNIEKLEFDLNMIAKLKPAAAVIYIEKGIGYEKYLREYAKEKREKIEILRKQLEEIKNDCCQYDTLEQWLRNITEKTEMKQGKTEDINVMTMHSAKGLEFEAVLILDMNQGILPTSKALRNEELEEERRVFYVAMTRAKRVLGIYGAMESLGCYIEPSMFIEEIINRDSPDK